MSRRKNRYQRRNAKREAKREKLAKYDNYDNLTNYTAIYNAIIRASKGVRWKASVQRFLINIFSKVYSISKSMVELKDPRMGFIEFDISERGKVRHIRSVHFNERVIQKTLCTNALYPMISRSLITDNCASQKGKGTHFALRRVVKFLRNYYNHYGNEGYVLKIDFKSYFDNIEHAPLKKMLRKYFADKNINWLNDVFIDAFGEKSLGLGSETSQINAILYPNGIDHWFKEVKRCRYCVRYNDDTLIIHHSKDELKEWFSEVNDKYKELGIKVNTKKTKITKLSKGFIFLKVRFFLTETGKIVRKPCRKSVTDERRKITRQIRLLQNGIMTLEELLCSYNGWRGGKQHLTARKTIFNMDKFLNDKLCGTIGLKSKEEK